MQLLSDTWLSTIIGVIVTILVAIVIFRMQRKRKEITFEVLSNTQVMNIEENAINGVQVMFGTRQVNDARLVVLRILNSGDEPVLPTDYIDPIKFVFGQNAEILEAAIVNKKPRNVRASVTHAANTLTLAPSLLNSKDSIEIKALTTNYHGDQIQCFGRIVGIKQITRRELNSSIATNDLSTFTTILSGVSLTLVFINILNVLYFNFTNTSHSLSVNIGSYPNATVDYSDLFLESVYLSKLEYFKDTVLTINIIGIIILLILIFYFIIKQR